MIIKQIRGWAENASTEDRSHAATSLAQSYLSAGFDDRERGELLTLLIGCLDDPSPLVRRALARVFATSADVPHHVVLALADDQSTVSAFVLCYSPVLSDADLIDCAATADDFAQSAIASRSRLSAPVAAALAEVAGREGLTALAHNLSAPLRPFSIHRMIERHGDHAELREALLARPDLPGAARVDLVSATMRALGAFVTERNWMSDERVSRVAREAKDKAAIVIAEASRGWPSALSLAAHLRQSGELTIGFAFRAILSARIDLFKATLSELSGMPIARVDGLTEQSDSAGFVALYRKAQLPSALLPAFQVALRIARTVEWPAGRNAGLSRNLVDRVLRACEAINEGELDKLLVLLRRFETEAAREEVRHPVASPRNKAPLMLEVPGLSEPLRLKEHGTDTGRRAPRRDLARRREPLFTIDMAALEAEMQAA